MEVGARVGQMMCGWLGGEWKRELLRRLAAHGVDSQAHEAAASSKGALTGKVVVLTGAIPGTSRETAAAKLESAGARVSASVSKKTDLVVAGGKAGAKMEEARGAGKPVVAADGGVEERAKSHTNPDSAS